MTSALPIYLFLVPFLAALAVGALVRDSRSARTLAVVALAMDAVLAVVALDRAASRGPLRTSMGGWPPPLGIEWALDPFGAGVIVLVAGVGAIVLIGTTEAAHRELAGRAASFHACALLMVSGLVGIAATADLFNLFVHLEIASLGAYSLVGSGDKGAPRAAIRYLAVGSLGATLYLLGVGHIYAATGTLHMGDAAARLATLGDARLATIGMALAIAGLAVKMALFPLHRWMPQAYASAPISAAVLLAPLFTKVAAFALIRIVFWVFAAHGRGDEDVRVLDALAWTGTAAILGGGILAAVATDLRRLFALSSVSQMGIIALGAGLGSATSLRGAMLHIANDALMKATLFVAAGILLHRFDVRSVEDLSRVRGRAPLTTAAIAVAGLSIVGVPPLCGFFGKWYVLVGALEAGRPALAAAVVASTLLSVVYVYRILEPLVLGGAPTSAARREGPAIGVAACVLLAALVALLGILNERVVSVFVNAAIPPGL